jgi:TRAP-type C4-dicarboxylate transport system substrate-binding protein
MPRRFRIAATLAGLVLLPAVVWLALIQPGADAPAGKSGGSNAVVLRLAVVEDEGTTASELAESFARRVESLSGGSIQVDTTYWPAGFEPGTPSDRIEAAALYAVRSRAVELGIFPAHAFHEAGVATLQALHTPFLITSSALAARVTTGPLADRAQAGLTGIRLTGLGLIPEGLYRPFGYLKPLLAPADFAGVTIRAPASKPMHDVLRTLRARPVEIDAAGTDTVVYSGFVASPGSLQRANDAFPQNAYTAGAVALFPKIDAIVASDDVIGSLTMRQRALLRRAAAEVRRERIAVTEQAAAAAFCAAGGTIVDTPAGALTELRQRTAPLLAKMRREPTTRALIAGIQRADARGSSSSPACGPAAADREVRSDDLPASVRAKLSVPAGSYRRVFSVAELRAAGADETEAQSNKGLVTLTVYGGRYAMHFVVEWKGSPRRPPCRGFNDLVDRRVTLEWNPATPCRGYVAFAWRLDGDDLVIIGLDPRSDPGWTAAFVGTWKRVDCTPWRPIYGGRWPAAEEERRKALPNGFCR